MTRKGDHIARRKEKNLKEVSRIEAMMLVTLKEKEDIDKSLRRLEQFEKDKVTIDFEKNRVRAKIEDLLKMKRFVSGNKEEVLRIKITEIQETCNMMEALFKELKKKELDFSSAKEEIHLRFNELLEKYKIKSELFELINTGHKIGEQRFIDLMEKKKNLINDIKSVSELIEKARTWQNQKKKSGKESQTLEDYMREQLCVLRDIIHKLSRRIKQLNATQKQMIEIIDTKREQIKYLKEEIRSFSDKDIKSSQQYQNIMKVQRNLQLELNVQQSARENLVQKTLKIMNSIHKNEELKTKKQKELDEIREEVTKLKSLLNEKPKLSEADNVIISNLKEQDHIAKEHLVRLSDLGRKLQSQHNKLKLEGESLKKECEDFESENQVILHDIFCKEDHICGLLEHDNKMLEVKRVKAY